MYAVHVVTPDSRDPRGAGKQILKYCTVAFPLPMSIVYLLFAEVTDRDK